MPHDPRVDAYIDKAQPFARPILRHLRDIVHRACPEAVEAIKWSMPMFLYRDKIIANMAAFKAHAAFGTWRRDGGGPGGSRAEEAMGSLGKLAGIDSLPPDAEIAAMVTEAMALVDAGGSMRDKRQPKAEIAMPDDLAAALEAVPAAAANFAAFPPGCRREYLEWVTEAKQAATRAKRIATTVEWTAEGKRRHWKYANC